jgi:hypothetical protein
MSKAHHGTALILARIARLIRQRASHVDIGAERIILDEFAARLDRARQPMATFNDVSDGRREWTVKQ